MAKHFWSFMLKPISLERTYSKRVFTREISSRDKIRPEMKSSLSMVECLLLSTPFCRDEISSLDEGQGWNSIPEWKKKKRHVNTSSWDEIFKWSCFFNFLRMYSSMFPKFNMFEHNESLNIMNIRPLCKKWSPKRKRMSTTSLLIFSLGNLEMIEVSICFNLLPSGNIEAFAQRCSVKKEFIEIWQNLQENSCARVSFLINLQASGV